MTILCRLLTLLFFWFPLFTLTHSTAFGQAMQSRHRTVLTYKQLTQLSLSDRKIYLSQLRQKLVQLERAQRNYLGQSSFATLWALPSAHARDIAAGAPCLYAGNITELVKRGQRLKCERPPQGRCPVDAPIPCNAALFGPNLCVPATARATATCVNKAPPVEEMAKSMTPDQWNQVEAINNYCNDPHAFQANVCSYLKRLRLSMLNRPPAPQDEDTKTEATACPECEKKRQEAIRALEEIAKKLPTGKECQPNETHSCVEQVWESLANHQNAFQHKKALQRDRGFFAKLFARITGAAQDTGPSTAKDQLPFDGALTSDEFLSRLNEDPEFREKMFAHSIQALQGYLSTLSSLANGDSSDSPTSCEDLDQLSCQLVKELSHPDLFRLVFASTGGGALAESRYNRLSIAVVSQFFQENASARAAVEKLEPSQKAPASSSKKGFFAGLARILKPLAFWSRPKAAQRESATTSPAPSPQLRTSSRSALSTSPLQTPPPAGATKLTNHYQYSPPDSFTSNLSPPSGANTRSVSYSSSLAGEGLSWIEIQRMYSSKASPLSEADIRARLKDIKALAQDYMPHGATPEWEDLEPIEGSGWDGYRLNYKYRYQNPENSGVTEHVGSIIVPKTPDEGDFLVFHILGEKQDQWEQVVQQSLQGLSYQ